MISLLNKNDYNKIIELGKEYDPKFEKKYLSLHYNIYVEENSNSIIGFIITEETIDNISIILLYISTSYRRQKVGSRLLDYIINNYDKNIILEVKSNNIPAINLYNKYNFKTINIRKEYYSDGTDALLMERRVKHE